MKHIFDFIDAVPQDIVFAIVGALPIAVAVSDRLLADRWSR